MPFEWLNILRSPTSETHPKDPPISSIVPEKAGRPKVNKAGLLFTIELDTAIERCKNKVRAIAEECRRANRKFRDRDFDCEADKDRCLHGLPTAEGAPSYEPVEALRVTQIFDKPQFFINGTTASDVAQGAIGDCWFVAALSVVATAGLIEKICVERDEQVGVYGFIFWRDAGWVDVIVDDMLFVQIPRWHDLSFRERKLYNDDIHLFRKNARKGRKALYFASSKEENETWVPLLEKAYAKLHGDYAALSGGWTGEAVEDLTGGVISIIFTKDILDPDRFWKDELLNANVDRAFDCALFNPGGNWSGETLDGIVMNHAYSVIRAVEYKDKRFVRVRNPWGEKEWTGRWSDGSKEWTEEWTPALKELGYKFGNDGEFVMEYSDFLATWDTLDRCRIFNHDWTTSQLWLVVNCGDYPSPVGFGDVSFKVNFTEDAQAVIALAQIDTRYFKGIESRYSFSLSFAVYKAGERVPVATSPHNSFFETCSRSVNVEVELPAGEYVVQVRIDRNQWKDPTKADATDDYGGSTYFNPDTLPFSWKRKLGQKVTEKLYSSSMAANFNSASYGTKMPLPPDTFQGRDITEFEIETQRLVEKRYADRKAVYPKAKPEETATDTTAATIATTTETVAATAIVAALAVVLPNAEKPTAVEGASDPTIADAAKPSEANKDIKDKDDASGVGASADAKGEVQATLVAPPAAGKADDKTSESHTKDKEPTKAKGSEHTVAKDEPIIDVDASAVEPPKQPDWLKKAWETLGAKYTDDKVDFVCRAVSESASPADWMVKCLDCPGKIYYSGPGQTLDNFETHLKNKQHRERVGERVKAAASASASKPKDTATTTDSATEKASHDRACNGCGVSPVLGSVYHCLDVACLNYDLCESCFKKKAHPADHKLVEFTHPDDFKKLSQTSHPAADANEDNSVVIGLRVYTKKECQVTIKGQLRHGDLIRGYLSSPKII